MNDTALTLASRGTPLVLTEARDERSTARWARLIAIITAAAGLASVPLGIMSGMRVLTVLGFVLAVAGLRRPTLGLLGVGMLCTLDSFARVYFFKGGLWRWNTLNYWLLFFLLLHLKALLAQRDVHTRLALVLWMLMALQLTISPDVMSGVYSLFNFTSLFGLQVYCLRGTRQERALYWLAVVSGVLGIVASMLFYVNRGSLPYMNKNAWASVPLTPVLLISIALLSGAHPRRHVTVLSCLGGCNLALVFLSASRGAFAIGSVALLITLLGMRRFTTRLTLLLLCGLASVPLLLLFPSLKDYAVRNMSKLWDPSRSLTSRTSGRWDLMIHGLYLAKRYPLGVGTGGYAETRATALMEYDPDDPSPVWLGADFRAGKRVQAHAGWIKVLVENGVPGFGLLLAYALSFAVVGLRYRRRGALRLGLLGTAVPIVGLLPSEFAGKWLWFTLALVTAEMRKYASANPRAGRGGIVLPSEAAESR